MEISIGSYKFRVEILVAIVIVSWIMFGHILCSCCRVNLSEGLAMMKEGLTIKKFTQAKKEGLTTQGRKAVAVGVYRNNNTDDSTTTEGFTGANYTSMGPEFAGAKAPDYIMNPSTWSMPTLTYSPGTTPDAGVKAIWDRPKQPVPLPEGELDMFASTPFAPECCPNAYSSSMGCACMTVDQYNYLRERGSNNVPYDIY